MRSWWRNVRNKPEKPVTVQYIHSENNLSINLPSFAMILVIARSGGHLVRPLHSVIERHSEKENGMIGSDFNNYSPKPQHYFILPTPHFML